VPDRGVQARAIERSVRLPLDGHEPACHRVSGRDDAEESFDLGGVADYLRPREYVMTAEADALGPALAQLQLPVAAARCQQHIAVTDAADRLPVGLAGPAAGEEDEHEPAAQRRGQRQRENGAHRNVDDVEEPLLQAPLQRRHRLCCHGPLLAAVVPWGAVPLASMSPWTAVQGRQAGHPACGWPRGPALGRRGRLAPVRHATWMRGCCGKSHRGCASTLFPAACSRRLLPGADRVRSLAGRVRSSACRLSLAVSGLLPAPAACGLSPPAARGTAGRRPAAERSETSSSYNL
jgi:hypothetical protein